MARKKMMLMAAALGIGAMMARRRNGVNGVKSTDSTKTRK